MLYVILYFGPDIKYNQNNEIIVYLITNILDTIKNSSYLGKEGIDDSIELVRVLRDFLRIYFKAEWKRANGTLKGSKVQKYLEKHGIYDGIIDIFSNASKKYDDHTEFFYRGLEEKYKIKSDS